MPQTLLMLPLRLIAGPWRLIDFVVSERERPASGSGSRNVGRSRTLSTLW